jgi:hypothetical protein
MPLIPTPTPAAAPTNVSLSGGVWVSGAGFNQTSGGPTAAATYSEVTQWISIDYTRNPRFCTINPATQFCDLTAVSGTQTRNVLATYLHFNITVHNSKKQIIQDYTLSSSYQPQKFAVQANRLGKQGGFYGEVSGPNNLYVFGAQGSIITTQPYVSRQPWISTATATIPADVEYELTTQGTNGYFQVSGGNPSWTPEGSVFEHCDINEDYANYLVATSRLEHVSQWPWLNNIGHNDNFPVAGGGYNTSAEVAFGDNAAGLQKLIYFIEAACAKLGSSNFHQRYALNSPFTSNGTGFIQEPDRVQINPYYTTARHDYT